MAVVKVMDIKPQISALIADAEMLITFYLQIVDKYIAVEADGNITLDRASLKNTFTNYLDTLKHTTNTMGGVYNKIYEIIKTISDA